MTETSKTRGQFGSKFGMIMALAGSAIGLGNLWRFPYLMGQNGGAAFLIIYLVSVLLVSIPAMVCEMSIGRRAGANSVGAMRILAPGKNLSAIGYLAVLTTIIILAFYCVVGGWSVSFLCKSFIFEFNNTSNSSQAIFDTLVTSSGTSLIYTYIFLGLTCLILIAGVKSGIEKFSKIMMPLLFVLVILVAVRAVTLPGAENGLKYMFKPDWTKVTGATILAAMSQAFFSLSIGNGTLLTYGSYISKDEHLFNTSGITAAFDTLFAILAGVAILPAVFAFGINPTEGPGLVFVTLPEIFRSMPFGGVIAIMFFLSLFLAALSSSISLMEVVLAYFVEEQHISRKKAAISLFILFAVLCGLCSLSNGVLSNFKIFGKTMFDLFDYISSNILMTLGALFFVVFVGWVLGKANFKDELENSGKHHINNVFFNALFFIVKFILPLLIFVIFLAGILS